MSKRARVLIVDDEPSVLTALQLSFEGVDWFIEVATSGATAMAKLEEPFDLMITDKNLPDLDGVELVRRVRERTADMRIILITGFGSLKSAIDTANLGIDAYIEKPFRDIFAVRAQVESLLGRDRPPSRIAQILAGRSARARPDTRDDDPPKDKRVSGDEIQVVIASAEARARKQIASHLPTEIRKHFAANAAELFEAMEEHSPDVVLIHAALDVSEFAQRVRKTFPSLRLVIASEDLDLATTKRLIQVGITAIIDKPIELDSFGDRLATIVRAIKKTKRKGT